MDEPRILSKAWAVIRGGHENAKTKFFTGRESSLPRPVFNNAGGARVPASPLQTLQGDIRSRTTRSRHPLIRYVSLTPSVHCMGSREDGFDRLTTSSRPTRCWIAGARVCASARRGWLRQVAKSTVGSFFHGTVALDGPLPGAHPPNAALEFVIFVPIENEKDTLRLVLVG